MGIPSTSLPRTSTNAELIPHPPAQQVEVLDAQRAHLTPPQADVRQDPDEQPVRRGCRGELDPWPWSRNIGSPRVIFGSFTPSAGFRARRPSRTAWEIIGEKTRCE
jgi:hypothetical protein